MDWVKNYELFLFDFDGLLVNTEHIHYQAYVNTLKRRGYALDWNFLEFCKNAHYESSGLEESIYAKFPKLQEEEPSWKVLYEEKKRAYLSLLQSGKVELMPGVLDLLTHLQENKKQSCVVTNSLKEQTDLIQAQLPILKTISHWITRGDYEFPKPNPECYLRAIELFSKPGDRIIGFEDTIKGLKALLKTSARSVLICPKDHPQLSAITDTSISHFNSFTELEQQDVRI